MINPPLRYIDSLYYTGKVGEFLIWLDQIELDELLEDWGDA